MCGCVEIDKGGSRTQQDFTSSCVRRLLRFGFNIVEIAAMAKPYCCKEAQAAPLHERGPAAMSNKKL